MGCIKKMKIGYIRSNGRDDWYEKQLNALNDLGCGRIFDDIGNGFSEFEHMLDYLREDDAVCVYQMDRFGLSVKHLMKLTYDFMNRNISLCSIHDNIDTSSAEGELLFKIFNVLSMCEQNAIFHEQKHEPTLSPIKKVEGQELYSNIRMMPTKEPSTVRSAATAATAPMTSMPSVGGRPRGLTAEAKQKAEAAAAMYQEGALSMREIASNLNISTATLYSYLRHEKVI